MLEKILQTLLRRYCGQFLTGIENIQFAFWTGKINLNNVSLKHEKINQILKQQNIPLSIKYSHIGSLQIDIPWKSLSSTPVYIKIQRVYIVLKIQKITSVTKKIQQQKMSLIKNYVQHLIKKTIQSDKSSNEDNQSGYMKNLIVKIIHNLNAEIKDISIRIISQPPEKQGLSSARKNQNQQLLSENSTVIKPITEMQNNKRRQSSTNSQKLKKKQKGFSFGLCLQQLSLQTVDQNDQRTFYASGNKKSAVRKILKMKQISAYLEEQITCNIFKFSQQRKNQFMKQIILREKYRLLSIDGKIIVNKNYEKNQFFDYFLTTNLQILQLHSTYGQLRQMTKILSVFMAASDTKQIKKLSQLDQHEQLKLKPQFDSNFKKFYQKNFSLNLIDEKFGSLLCSVSKKNLLSWTKSCTTQIIKQTKVQMVKKQRNKKGWLSYIISQAQVILSQQQINQIYQQVEEIIKQIEYSKKISLGLQFFFSKINFLISHQHLEEYLSFQLINSQIKYTNLVNSDAHFNLSVLDILLKYTNKKENLNLALIKKDSEILQNQFIFFELKKFENQRIIKLDIAETEINHETRVLLLIHQILKLKTQQQMKSDVKLKRIQLAQNKQIEQQLGKQYNIDINISRLLFKIEVSQASYIQISLDSILIKTDQNKKIHIGTMSNLIISYINSHKKSKQRGQNVNYILKDFTINFTISNYFNKIWANMASLQLIINEADLNSIYRNFLKQSQLFKSQKTGQKNKRINEYSYIKGHLKLMNIMKTWKDYQGVLTDQGLFLFELQVFDEQNQTQVHQNYSHMIPINNLQVTIVSEQQFRIQSGQVNQIIECSKDELQNWVDFIERIVFDNSSRAKMYNLIDKDDNLTDSQIMKSSQVIKHETQINFEFQRIQILICQNKQKNLMRIQLKTLLVSLNQNTINFQRSVTLEEINIRKLQSIYPQSDLNFLLTNKKGDKASPIKFKVVGKKKLHPQYKGQLQIKVAIGYLKANYDPQFIYKMIKKIAWGHQVPSYTNQMRNTKVLQMTKQFLRSSAYQRRQSQLLSPNCKILQNYHQYAQINRYKAKGYTCVVLLSVKISVEQAQINLINGINSLCMFYAKANKLTAKIDKGSQFLFFKLTANDLQLYDTTGYPHTNVKPYKIASLYPLLTIKQNRTSKQAVQCSFSRFNLDRFINKSRIKSFFILDVYDPILKFQNQLINRFFDYLFNQIIGFILAPNSLHKFDGPRRGPFLYENNLTMTQKQVKQIISDALQPFFSKMMINAYNLTVTLNSFPNMQAIDIEIESMKIQSFNFEKSQKIQFNTSQLSKAQKHPVYKQLLKMPGFQQKLLKNHWASRLNIIVQGLSSIIFTNQVAKIQTYVQRTINTQKQILYPFITLDNSLICQSFAKNMSIKAPREIYNLINKCIMFNIAYDDQQDSNYNHNSHFKHLMKVSQIFYKLKTQEMQIIIPQLKTVIAIPDFQYKFLRLPSQNKEMIVQGKSMNIFKGSQVIMMTSEIKDKNIDVNGLEYKIEMKTTGQKIMQAKLKYVDIIYNLPFFLKFTQYTILDQSCYPPLPPGTIINQLPDLPLISCKVHLQNSRIKLIVPNAQDDGQFICSGHIGFVWNRNSLIHPQRYAKNPQNFPNNKQWCNYKIQLKDINIRKHYRIKTSSEYNNAVTKSAYNNLSKDRYRSISNKITLIFKISQLMKLSSNQIDRYNDNIFQLKIIHLGLKLSYTDIQQLKSVFVSKPEQDNKVIKKQPNLMQQSQQLSDMRYEPSQKQIQQKQQKQKPLSYTPYTKYTIDINKIQIQLGLSQLPVPLLNLVIKSTKSSIEMIGPNKTISMKAIITANCWNMLIGRWQPIIQELSPTINLKLSKDKYLLFDCPQMLLFNLSLQSLKILKLISSDFSQKGKFSISQINKSQGQSSQKQSENKIKGINISPYVINNRTGIPIQIWNQQTSTGTKLKPDQKTYIDLKNYQMEYSAKLKTQFQFQGAGSNSKYQVNMDMATSKKIKVQYKKKQYQILLKPLSTSIMKQIIISSLFIVENKTCYGLVFYYNCGQDQEDKDIYEGRIKVLPKQKTALKFTASIKNYSQKGNQKNLKIQFPQLPKDNIQNNCQFPYQALLNVYQHCIEMNKNKTFNCVISLHQQLQSTIVIQPSFFIKNLLPVKIQVHFVIQRNGQKLMFPQQLDINQQKDIYDFSSKQSIQIRLKINGFNISPLQSIANENNNEYKSYLDLIDYRGQAGKIFFKVIKQGKVRKMYIYSQAILINQTQYDWNVFTGSRLIPGQKLANVQQSQTIYTFLNVSEYQTLNFGFGEDNPFNSDQLKITEIGIHNMSMYKGTALYQFTIKNTFHCLDNYALIYSYVLKAEPTYIIVNQTSTMLEIAQADVDNKSQLVKAGQRLNWIWPNRTQAKSILVRCVYNQINIQDMEWAYSNPIKINNQDIQQSVFVLRSKNVAKPDKKLLKIIPIKQHLSRYFLIEEVKKIQDHIITINNQLQYCKLRAYQQNIDNNKNIEWYNTRYFQISPRTSIPFGLDYPHQPQQIIVQVAFLGYLKSKFDAQSININLDQQKIQQFIITNQDGQTQQLTIKIQIIGLRKKVTFSKRQNYQEEDPQLQMMHVGNRFAFSFTEIGVSVITSVKKRAQLLFLNLKKVQIIMMEKKSSRSLQVKVKYINIDNNYNHNTIYPILLTPLKHAKTLNKSRPFFVLLLQQTLQSKDIIQIKQFRVCNQPLSIKIHDQILTAVWEMILSLNKETDKNQGKIDLLSLFRSQYKQMQWQQLQIVKPQRDIFFRQFEIAKLQLQITFSIRPKLNTNNFIIMTILSSFGAAISNVSEAQLTLSRFLKKDKGLNQLKTQLSNFYFRQFMIGIYKVLGSITLFGNPYVFIRMLSEGAWEIVNQPTQGFIKGPIQGALGIAKGSIFFTRNVVAGTCNSLQAISESISRGVSYMTMDQKFIQRRQKIKNQKSNHFFKGLQYGVFSLYTGVQVALTGLVRHPVEGYEQRGFVGGLTGTLKGVAGLVTKPISGTFQGISKVSQGIKNTALLFQDGPNSKRIRPPRIFISQLSYYKNYNIYESTAMQVLEFTSTKYLYQQINFISLVWLQDQKYIDAYVMTQKYFCHVDIINKKLIRQIEIKDIKQVHIQHQSLHIMTHRQVVIINQENFQQLYQAFNKFYVRDR